jgi:tetratricopeptide (TPR) repeat protein
VRDYDVQYVVTVVLRGGLREYEQLFAQSDRYHFTVAKRFADLDIVKVEAGSAPPEPGYAAQDSSERGIRLRFAKAIKALTHNEPEECERILDGLPASIRRQVVVLLNLATAKEFMGKLDVANRVFEQFQKLQQAGSIVQPAWYHLQTISMLKAAENARSGFERARILHSVASYYWILGYRDESLLTLDRSIQSDSAFFPSLIFRGIYSLLNGDTLRSARYLGRARLVDPVNPLVTGLSNILRDLQALRNVHGHESRIGLDLKIARQLRSLGLRENAIDELLQVDSLEPTNEECLRMLVDLYIQKARYAPALRYLRRLVALRPDKPALKEELIRLESRW